MILSKIFPVIFAFFLGFFLKKINVFSHKNGDIFLNFIFYVTLPALILNIFSKTTLNYSLLFLPLSAVITIFITLLSSIIIITLTKIDNSKKGVIILGSSIMNMGFVFPFIVKLVDKTSLVKANLFDLGNCLLAFTLIYSTANYFGKKNKNIVTKEILKIPPLWAMLIGIIISIFKINLPLFFYDMFSFIGDITLPLLIFSLGLYFDFKIKNIKLIFITLFIRIFIGFLTGFTLSYIFNFDSLTKKIIITSCSAPIGYNTLVFSKMQKLDTEFAAELVSFGLLTGLFITPLFLYFF